MMKFVLFATLALLAGCQTKDEKLRSAFTLACHNEYQRTINKDSGYVRLGASDASMRKYTHNWMVENSPKFDYEPKDEQEEITKQAIREQSRRHEKEDNYMIATALIEYASVDNFFDENRLAASCIAVYDRDDYPEVNSDFAEVYLEERQTAR